MVGLDRALIAEFGRVASDGAEVGVDYLGGAVDSDISWVGVAWRLGGVLPVSLEDGLD